MKKMSLEDKLFLSHYKHHKVAHIRIIDETVCNDKCQTKICTVVCPVKSYEKNSNGNIMFNYENCMECGSCRIICPENNLEWSYPVFGCGVSFRQG